MIRFGAIAAWVVMTVLFSFAAWQVVKATEGETTESPSAPLVMEEGLSIPSTTTTAPSSTTTSSTVTTSTVPTSSTTSTNPPASGGTAATTTPTTATSSAPAQNTRVIETYAGTVSVSYRSGEVYFKGATPAIGWTVEVENTGPVEVEVEFEREDQSVDVTVQWEYGELEVEIDEESDEESDD